MILHLDMDAFYAAVEQLDNPRLRGKCVIVGGDSERGVVTTASYEARRFGVRSAMPMFMARRKCPHAVIVPTRMERYKTISRQVMAILRNHSPIVEQVSIDEAYADLSGLDRLKGSPMAVADLIKQRIREETGLTCSVGLAPVKFLAKIASDLEKPDGLTLISPDEMADFIAALPVEKVSGVGKVAAERLHKLGIQTLGDLRVYPEKPLIGALGKFGHRLKELANGVDRSAVTPNQPPKSISSEETLAFDTADKTALARLLLTQSEEVGSQLRRHGFLVRTVTLKVKHADFQQATRSTTLNYPTQSNEIIYQTAIDLLDRYPLDQPVRLIGVGASKLLPVGTPIQMDLFDDRHFAGKTGWHRVDHAVDRIRRRFGADSIQKAASVQSDRSADLTQTSESKADREKH